MPKKNLRVASEDDVPRPHMSISDAAESGTQLDQLVAMRRVIARALDSDRTLARDLASLSKRLMEVSKEIEEVQAREREVARDVEVEDAGTAVWRPEAL